MYQNDELYYVLNVILIRNSNETDTACPHNTSSISFKRAQLVLVTCYTIVQKPIIVVIIIIHSIVREIPLKHDLALELY